MSVCEYQTCVWPVPSLPKDLPRHDTPVCMQILPTVPDKCCCNVFLLVLEIQSQKQVPGADYREQRLSKNKNFLSF